jgi:ubiquinone/menaquinone biosynthesis C-methylase UbiE
MIHADGWKEYCIWEHSSTVAKLYAQRCRLEAEEMTCSAQAVTLLQPKLQPNDAVLDVGCGSGYLYHSFHKRNVPVRYLGIDAAPRLIEIGREILPHYGLPAEQLQTIRIEDLSGSVDHVVCINVLSNIDNFHRPLERMLKVAKKTVILRESFTEQSSYHYVVDKYLDTQNLRVHVNSYGMQAVLSFARELGFDGQFVTDQHANDKPEMVIDYPHYWKFLVLSRG